MSLIDAVRRIPNHDQNGGVVQQKEKANALSFVLHEDGCPGSRMCGIVFFCIESSSLKCTFVEVPP
jgi:hypothetical protein